VGSHAAGDNKARKRARLDAALRRAPATAAGSAPSSPRRRRQSCTTQGRLAGRPTRCRATQLNELGVVEIPVGMPLRAVAILMNGGTATTTTTSCDDGVRVVRHPTTPSRGDRPTLHAPRSVCDGTIAVWFEAKSSNPLFAFCSAFSGHRKQANRDHDMRLHELARRPSGVAVCNRSEAMRISHRTVTPSEWPRWPFRSSRAAPSTARISR